MAAVARCLESANEGTLRAQGNTVQHYNRRQGSAEVAAKLNAPSVYPGGYVRALRSGEGPRGRRASITVPATRSERRRPRRAPCRAVAAALFLARRRALRRAGAGGGRGSDHLHSGGWLLSAHLQRRLGDRQRHPYGLGQHLRRGHIRTVPHWHLSGAWAVEVLHSHERHGGRPHTHRPGRSADRRRRRGPERHRRRVGDADRFRQRTGAHGLGCDSRRAGRRRAGRMAGARFREGAATETGDGVLAWMVLRQVDEYGEARRRNPNPCARARAGPAGPARWSSGSTRPGASPPTTTARASPSTGSGSSSRRCGRRRMMKRGCGMKRPDAARRAASPFGARLRAGMRAGGCAPATAALRRAPGC